MVMKCFNMGKICPSGWSDEDSPQLGAGAARPRRVQRERIASGVERRRSAAENAKSVKR
jgi:hypothetical protein